MSNDPDDYVADCYPVLISGVQRAAVEEADKARATERDAAAVLRQQHQGNQGLNTSELLAELYGEDEAKQQAKLDATLDKINREAAEAAKAKETTNEGLADAKYPPPIITAGT